jgi:uncharacterized integral membrane protein
MRKESNMNVKLIIGLVIICLVAIFIIQNAAIVEIQVFFWTIAMSSILLMFILLFIGVAVGWLLNSYYTHKKEESDNY